MKKTTMLKFLICFLIVGSLSIINYSKAADYDDVEFVYNVLGDSINIKDTKVYGATDSYLGTTICYSCLEAYKEKQQDLETSEETYQVFSSRINWDYTCSNGHKVHKKNKWIDELGQYKNVYVHVSNDETWEKGYIDDVYRKIGEVKYYPNVFRSCCRSNCSIDICNTVDVSSTC